MTKYPMVYVEWLDIKGIPGWTSLKDIKAEPCRCVTAGFLIKQTEKLVVISPHIADVESDEVVVDGTFVIPTSVITQIQEINYDRTL